MADDCRLLTGTTFHSAFPRETPFVPKNKMDVAQQGDVRRFFRFSVKKHVVLSVKLIGEPMKHLEQLMELDSMKMEDIFKFRS